MEIKDIIKTRRITLGITQAQLAAAVGVSEATVSRWESGDISNMKRSRIAALAKALQISPSVVMGWDEEIEKAEGLGYRVDALKKKPRPPLPMSAILKCCLCCPALRRSRRRCFSSR